jgi:hypothetical protein
MHNTDGASFRSLAEMPKTDLHFRLATRNQASVGFCVLGIQFATGVSISANFKVADACQELLTDPMPNMVKSSGKFHAGLSGHVVEETGGRKTVKNC